MNTSTSNTNLNEDIDPWNDEGDIDITELEKILDQPDKDNSRLRNQEQYVGFDDNVANTWIYPNNLPCRSYQQSITQAALYRNTLVVLPTGLGKTFIAAVVMYNIYRWYPKGKVIFMAPTRPLVAQQIGACQKIMPFPVQDTVDITGKVRREKRIEYWRNKRVFFATPQVVQADMSAQSELDEPFPFKEIKLIVVDEAHKARGRYAYTEVAQMLWRHNRYFRVLGLSATPGRTMDDVAEVVRNLFIAHLEVRWDSSIDVVSYVHHRSMKTIVVPLCEKIKSVREELVKIIDPYLRQLIDAGVLSGSHQHITRNFLLFEQKRFRERSLHERHSEHAAVNSNFSLCISLFHSLELLERHGLRVFINSFEDDEEGRSKFVITLNPALRDLVTRLRNELGPNPFDISAHAMTNGSLPEMPADLDFGHPKFQKARECLLEHFKKNPESRAIVFCEYRESVMLIYRLLLQHVPMLKPRCFVGQGGTTGPLRALSQKQQIQIMEDFRAGKSNILIATSIGEEGIDVGEVDLIVCFDISTSNPTRFIQRIGRTGRQRRGYVTMLVTEGKEQQLLKEVLANKDQTNKKILHSSVVQRAFYKESPRLVPTEYNPKCVQTFIKPQAQEEQTKCMEKVKSKNSTSKQKEKKSAPKVVKSKQKTIENTQDLRKFFKKTANDSDAEDLEIFQQPLRTTPVITQRTAERSLEKVKSLFKDLNMNSMTNSNTQLLGTQSKASEESEEIMRVPRLNSKEIKKLNRLLKSSNDLVPVSQRGIGLLEKLKSSNFSRAGKLYLLKRRYSYVHELFEKMDILKALDIDNDMSTEEQEVRETCQEILKLFEDREALDRFLEDAEYSSQTHDELASNDTDEFAMSTQSFQLALDKIFIGLDQQGPSWDSFDYRQEELQKTNSYKQFIAEHNARAKEHESNCVLNSVVFDGNPSDSTTQFDQITITDSKYCSQWAEEFDESEVFNESKRFKPVDKTTSLDETCNQNVIMPNCEPNNQWEQNGPTTTQSNETRNQKLTMSNCKPYSQWEQDFPQNKIRNKSTPFSGPLAQAFERQKDKQKVRKSLEMDLVKKCTKREPICIEIDSENDEICCLPLINEISEKEDNKPCDKRNCSTSSYAIDFKSTQDEVLPKAADIPWPPKSIEESFMSRQQSTPIPKKTYNMKPTSTDVSLQHALEINLDDFIEPFPEELEILTEKLDNLSGSSLKENTKPNLIKTSISSTSASYTSDLFRLLEAKPTNTVMTPKITSKSFKSDTILTPPSLRNSPVCNSPKYSSPVALLDSPKNRPNTSLAMKKYETSPSIMQTFTKGLQRLESVRKPPSSLSIQTTNSTVTSNTAAMQESDSPIVRKSNKDVNLKRKILESETESEATPPTVRQRNSDSDFEEITATQQPKRRCLTQRREKRLRRARLCQFFDQEAEKSCGSGHTSEEEDGENTENTLANFVCDSVIVNDDEIESDDDDRPTGTQMQAVYLQSVKSPHQRGRFKIPAQREFENNENIYSQPIPIEESQYVDDSFVVDEGDATVQNTLCPLERAEQILKERKRKHLTKKRRFAEVGIVNPVKKRLRKCYQLQDDSDTSDGGG